jgi:formylmethanofuran dehydrogenase subunit A
MTYILVDSNWIALDLVERGDLEALAAYYAWLLESTKGYALKLVDPGSDVAWLYGKMGLDLDDYIPGYSITPRDLIETVGKISEYLNLPHQIHVHCNRLGYPGNYVTTLETMKLAEKYTVGEEPGLHITHVQFTGYKGDNWSDLRSGGEDIAKTMNRNRCVTLDLGQVIPGFKALTMTADAPFEFVLYHLTKGKWSFADVEAETASGIVPYEYKKKNYVNTIQWLIGLEVLLLTKDIWRIYVSTDHPNAGPFTAYPKVFSWLMSARAREEVINEMNRRAIARSALPSVDRELTLYDIAVLTRASPAKTLGLDDFKGHLGIGAQADIAIYDIDPSRVDLSRDHDLVAERLRRAKYTIKDGEIVVKDGDVVASTYGYTYYAKAEISEDILEGVREMVKEKFKEYYSVTYRNFIVHENEIRNPRAVTVKPSIGGV